jgi:type VI secretion system protein ImpL
VQGPFRRLRELSAGPQGTAPVDALAKSIQEYVLSLEATENAMRSGVTSRSTEAETRLKSDAARMPTPVREILEALAGSASSQATQTLRSNAAASVKGGVGQLCATAISGRYPFVRGAQQDVLPNDFAQLFAPGAGMDDFFQKNLAQFVDTSKPTWMPRPGVEGAGAGSAADLAQFQRARDIRDAFFASGGRVPGFEVDVRISPVGTEKIELDVDGQSVTALDGGKRVSWPGPRKTNAVKLTVGTARPLVTEGYWALHRLIDRGRLQAGTPPERVVVTVNVDGRDVTLEFRSMSVRNPLKLPALQSFTCPGRS